MQESAQVVLSISEINRLARLALEKHLPSCWIRGELSNLSRASSGHWYFTLKDASASARCVMFRIRNQFVDWPVREGDQIEIRAQASLYEPRGDFQLIVEAMRQAGQGSLYEAFLRLKDRLQQEGLFEPERKKAIPPLPRAIGVITSPMAAALRDVLTTLKRRWPYASATLYPCQVQGDAAPAQIQQAIHDANLRGEVDVLLLVRGGGSLEDLLAFNDEGVARAVATSNIPIICGVGHETDFTIADFVADLRAPTPTGAAQLATPDTNEWVQRIKDLGYRLSHRLRSRLDAAWQHQDHLQKRLRHPQERLRHQHLQLQQLNRRLVRSGHRLIEIANARMELGYKRLSGARPATAHYGERLLHLRRRLHQYQQHQQTLRTRQLTNLITQLELLCPSLVLQRGYSIVRNVQGTVVKSPDLVRVGERLSVELSHGQLGVTVTDKSS
jgi:exodeoxyribonuclease VII large subunit